MAFIHKDVRVLLCVDLSYQCYRAAAANPNLTSRRIFTGGLYGFLNSFGKTMRETRATDVAFCQDVKPYLRSKTYPDYKLLRKKHADEELLAKHKESMPLILECLEVCGVQTWGLPGFESDDLIGHAVRRYRGRFKRIYAASNDSDLFQLLDIPNFAIYKDSITSVVDAQRLAKAIPAMTPAEYTLMTALTGTHNDIAGIPRVGPVTALKAVRDASAMRKLRADWGALIDRNIELIRLPHAELPATLRLPVHRSGFNARALYRYLDRYDINCTLAMEDAFTQFLGR